MGYHIKFTDIIRFFLEKGPHETLKKVQHDFILFGAGDFERRINGLLNHEKRRGTEKQIKREPQDSRVHEFQRVERFAPPPHKIIEAEIIE